MAKPVKVSAPKRKWFFDFQQKLEWLLKQEYENWQCNYQDVTANRVHESYTCRKKDGSPEIIHAIMFKVSNSISLYKVSRAVSIHEIGNDTL